MIRTQRWFILLLLSTALLGCGGGGGDDSNTGGSASSVNAGVDQTVDETNSFTLNALGDPVGGTFAWRQLSGITVTGIPATTASVTLTAPAVKADSILVFQVTYTTPAGQNLTDEVQVRVMAKNQAPVAVLQITQPAILPVAQGLTAIVSAASSYDLDADGRIATYLWTQAAGPAVALSGVNTATVSFVAPLVASQTDVELMLTITDDEGATGEGSIKVPVRASTQQIVADAGPDQQVREFAEVQLDGSGTRTVTGSFSCRWSQLKGQALVLINPTSCQASFIAPDISGTSQLELQLTVTDSNNQTATDTMLVTVSNAVLGDLPDTGVLNCYDISGVIPCGDETYPRQDADGGRDSVVQYLRKIGKGEKAFDFTKLDQFGDELADTANDFSCIRDNVTGLIWELKEPVIAVPPASTLRAANNRYSFVNSNAGNGDEAGVPAPALSSCPSAENCGLEVYVEEVNETAYCGGANWRLPTLEELMSIADFGRVGENHLLDPAFFRFEPDSAVQNNMFYWTTQSSAEGGGGVSAWVFDIRNGNDNTLPKQQNQLGYVRLVRSP
ncbi:DUF1566 domain-containing protein [Rheinheimera sp. 1928-s]|uniref:Lcl C-terminal domain-containing protein n=1 Tax=Rheinheimera sp. 1928-s TaxID=3033803 RepID=UPI002613573B|nr:DUF1566 domain-containing protein [Rheinheimera sp. 1928-s]MDF3126168.1 DUF1566 domain-containing protein [Rheinheimera sp. 1928-s]